MKLGKLASLPRQFTEVDKVAKLAASSKRKKMNRGFIPEICFQNVITYTVLGLFRF